MNTLILRSHGIVLINQKDSGAFLERRFAGLTTVEIQCAEETYDFTNSTWGYQVVFFSIVFVFLNLL